MARERRRVNPAPRELTTAAGARYACGVIEDADARRRAFSANAPRLRETLVDELSSCIARAATLSDDEACVLRHVLAYAGFTEAGDLRIPGLKPLWGESASYVPAVRRPAENVRFAVRLLVRRGVLRGVGDEIALDADVVRGLPATPPPFAPPPAEPATRPRGAVKKRPRAAPVRAKKKKR